MNEKVVKLDFVQRPIRTAIEWSRGKLTNSSLKTAVSKYMSYLLRHNPKSLKMDNAGFVRISDLLRNLRKRYDIDEYFIREVVEKSDRRRFQIVGDKIRAIYGHTIDVGIKFPVDERIRFLYHGTTEPSASIILKEGLKPMKRRWVHLSATPEIAKDVGKRRTSKPTILVIDAGKARQEGIKFHKATNQVYLSEEIPSKFIKILDDTNEDTYAHCIKK